MGTKQDLQVFVTGTATTDIYTEELNSPVTNVNGSLKLQASFGIMLIHHESRTAYH